MMSKVNKYKIEWWTDAPVAGKNTVYNFVVYPPGFSEVALLTHSDVGLEVGFGVCYAAIAQHRIARSKLHINEVWV